MAPRSGRLPGTIAYQPRRPQRPKRPGDVRFSGAAANEAAQRPRPPVPPPVPRIPSAAPPAPSAPPVDPGPAAAPIAVTESPEERAAREAREYARRSRAQALTNEDAGDETNFREMLRRYRENLPRQRRNALTSANRAGLVNSTTRSEQEGDIETNFVRGEADMTTARNERKAARTAARRLLEAGGNIEEAEAVLGSAQNRGTEYEEMADEGMLAPPTTDPVVTPVRQENRAPGRGGFRTIVKPSASRGGQRSVYHVYPGRQPVYVRPATRRRGRR